MSGSEGAAEGVITKLPGQLIVKCSDPDHAMGQVVSYNHFDDHPATEWPWNCVGFKPTLLGNEKNPAVVITVAKLPESFVDQSIADTAERKECLKQYLDLDITTEVCCSCYSVVCMQVVCIRSIWVGTFASFQLPAVCLGRSILYSRTVAAVSSTHSVLRWLR